MLQGAILQRLVREAAPRNAVEVGGMCGYSAILIAQALEPGATGYNLLQPADVVLRRPQICSAVRQRWAELRCNARNLPSALLRPLRGLAAYPPATQSAKSVELTNEARQMMGRRMRQG